MIPTEDFKSIVDNLGINGSKAHALIYKHLQEIPTARDDHGISLLAHAIQKNDGGNVATLLMNGADIQQSTKLDGAINHLEYAQIHATYEGRKPYAYEAIQSFLDTRQSIGLPFLNNTLKEMSSKNKMFEEAKNKTDDEYVSLYHGCKLFSLNESTSEGILNTYLASNCIQQASGPTLALNPVGQYWMTVGFEVQIPRKEIEFPGENKNNPTIKITEDGNALICNAEQNLKLDEYHTKFLINPYCLQEEEIVMPSYGTVEGDYKVKFSIDNPTLNKLHKIKAVMEINQEKVLTTQAMSKEHVICANLSEAVGNISELRNSFEQNTCQGSLLRIQKTM